MPFTRRTDNWEPLGAGGFNEVYLNAEKGLVFKVNHTQDQGTDTPERSVALWNLLNPKLKPKAKIATITLEGRKVTGWTCPYVRSHYNTQPFSSVMEDKDAYKIALRDPNIIKQEDQAFVAALIEIYNRTGRIVVDAAVPGNFVSIEPGKAICVDIGMALLLEQQEETCLQSYARRHSIVSNSAWETLHQGDMSANILKNTSTPFPQTLQMVKALLFLRAHRPDIIHVDFLQDDPNTVQKLAKAYETQSDEDHGAACTLLAQKRPLDLIQMKQSCTEQLLRYIHARGTLDEGKQFTASWVTKLFRNKLLTQLKVDSAQLLIKNINNAQSIADIQATLSAASKQPLLQKGLRSDFSTVLGLCKVISQVPPTVAPNLQAEFK